MKVLNLLASCAAIMLVTTSCEHKELCYDHPHIGRVNVVFDWRNAPDANPESMYLFLYPKEGGAPEEFEFPGRDGGVIEVLEGDYVAVCINSDTEKIRYTLADGATYSGQRFNYFEVYTASTTATQSLESPTKAEAPRADGAEDERVAYAPEAIWTDTDTEVTILSIKVTKEQTITLYPSQAYCNYTVKLRNIANADIVSEMSATISGMAGGLLIAQRMPTDEAVTFPFGITFDAENATGEGSLLTFGHCPNGDDHTHSVVVYAVMEDGSKYYYTVDVTDQVHNAEDPYNVVIYIDDVPLPDPYTAVGSGTAVSEWEQVIIDLPMVAQ